MSRPMSEPSATRWHHQHNFTANTQAAERKVNIVFALTTLTMLIEIVAGSWFGSMALLADGWHMFTHSAAFAISLFVYWYARKHQNNPAYSFGTGKVNALGGFASAVALGTVALMMLLESAERLFSPHDIRFQEAIVVAIIGLVVNIVSAVLLHDDHHHHGHSHAHNHTHDHHHSHHHDHNLKAAYFHVLADTLTSLLAIIALVAGMYFGWYWADALMGIIGAIVIARWALHLVKDSSALLLDKSPSTDTLDTIKSAIESPGTCKITDLHLWSLSDSHQACIVSVASSAPKHPDEYKALIKANATVAHLTVEVNSVV